MDKDFHRRMIEEKELDGETIPVEHNGQLHMVEMPVILNLIDMVSQEDRNKIHHTMSIIDFKNGDMMHFMNHLAKAYVETNF